PSASRARPNASRVALPISRLVFTAEAAPAMGSPPFPVQRACEKLIPKAPSTRSAHLGQSLVQVLGRDRLAVAVDVAQLLQEAEDALYLVGEADDSVGLALRGLGAVERLHDFAHVVAVDHLRVPAERGELAVDRVHVQDVFGCARLLVMVAIDDER